MSTEKAIAAQLEVVAANPGDVRQLQRLGELFQKAGDPKSAAEVFARVARSYADDGFFMKAIALLKQVLKLDPRLSTARESLAGWYLRLELKEEAAEQYRLLLNQYRFMQAANDACRVVDRYVSAFNANDRN